VPLENYQELQLINPTLAGQFTAAFQTQEFMVAALAKAPSPLRDASVDVLLPLLLRIEQEIHNAGCTKPPAGLAQLERSGIRRKVEREHVWFISLLLNLRRSLYALGQVVFDAVQHPRIASLGSKNTIGVLRSGSHLCGDYARIAFQGGSQADGLSVGSLTFLDLPSEARLDKRVMQVERIRNVMSDDDGGYSIADGRVLTDCLAPFSGLPAALALRG